MLYKKIDFKIMGGNIKKERQNQKLSQEKLAVMSDMTTETLRGIENNPDSSLLRNVVKVTNVLCVSLEKILY